MANKLLHGLSRLSHPQNETTLRSILARDAVPPSQPSPAGSRHPLKVKLHAAAPERWKRWKLGINGNWTFEHLDSMEFNGIQWNSMEFNGIQWNPIGLRNPEIHGMVRNGSMASHRINGSTQRPPAHVWPGPSRLLRAFFPAPRQKNPSGTSYCSNTEAEKPMEKPHQRSIHFSIEKNPIRSVCAAYPATDSSLPWLRKRHGRLPQLPGRFIKTWQWQKYGGLVRKIIEMVNFPHYQRVHYCRSRG